MTSGHDAAYAAVLVVSLLLISSGTIDRWVRARRASRELRERARRMGVKTEGKSTQQLRNIVDDMTRR